MNPMNRMSPQRIDLDYVVPRRKRWIGMALLAAALVVAQQLVAGYRDLLQERAALVARIELLDTGRAAARPVSARRLEQDAKGVESVLARLALPWPQMIESVESTAGPQVALLQLQPEPERRLLRLTAQAETPQAMLEYLRRLGEANGLFGVHLVSHRVQRDDPSHPVQFVAQASLRDAK